MKNRYETGEVLRRIPDMIPVVSVAALWFFLLSTCPAFAELYRYVDESGRVFYTNSLESVPPHLRQKVQVENEIKTVDQKAQTAQQDLQDVGPTVNGKKEGNKPSYDPSRGKELKERAKKLDKEFGALEEERKRLEQERSSAKTRADLKKYTQHLESYKKKAEDYQKRRDELARDIKEHKAALKAYLEQNVKDTEKKGK